MITLTNGLTLMNDWIIDYFIIHPIQVISLVRAKQIQTVPSGEQMWYEKHLKDIVKLNWNTSSVEVLPCREASTFL